MNIKMMVKAICVLLVFALLNIFVPVTEFSVTAQEIKDSIITAIKTAESEAQQKKDSKLAQIKSYLKKYTFYHELSETERAFFSEFYGVSEDTFAALDKLGTKILETVQLSSTVKTFNYSIDEIALAVNSGLTPKTIFGYALSLNEKSKTFNYSQKEYKAIKEQVIRGTAPQVAHMRYIVSEALGLAIDKIKPDKSHICEEANTLYKTYFKNNIKILGTLSILYDVDMYTLALYSVNNNLSQIELRDKLRKYRKDYGLEVAAPKEKVYEGSDPKGDLTTEGILGKEIDSSKFISKSNDSAADALTQTSASKDIQITPLSTVKSSKTSVIMNDNGTTANVNELGNVNGISNSITPMANDPYTKDIETNENYIPQTDTGAEAPYVYKNYVDEDVSLASGDLAYRSKDLVVPGKNGLDLELSVQYNSSDSNLNDFGVDYTTRLYYEYGYSGYTPDYSVYANRETYYTNGLGYFVKVPPSWPTIEGKFIENQYVGTYTTIGQAQIAESNHTYNYEYLETVYGMVYEMFEINEAIIYDSDGDEVVPSYFVVNNEIIEANNYLTAETYFEKHHELGAGWSFGFDWIGTQDGTKYLHLANGGTYEVLITATVPDDSNLVKYSLRDMRLEADGQNFNNGTISSYYCLFFKDGKKEYFSYNGQLIGIVDRFGNTITFEYNGTTNTPSRIIDSVGRQYVFTMTTISSTQKQLVIDLPETTAELVYNINRIDGTASDYQLTSKVDMDGKTTTYTYNKSASSVNFLPNVTGCTAIENSFNLLQSVSYPNGATNSYDYTSYSKKLGEEGGIQQYYRVTARRDGQAYNVKNYSYTLSSLNNGVATSADITDQLGRKTTTTYNSDNLPTQERLYISNVLKQQIDRTYNDNKLTETTTTTIYSGSKSTQNQTKNTYDQYANLNAHWDEMAEGDFASTNDHYTLYEYTYYSILASKTYKKDAATTISEVNTLSATNKTVATKEVKVNGLTKETKSFTYDSYGNLLTETSFPASGTIVTQFGYTHPSNLSANYDNVFVTSKSISGVVDSDGNPIQGSTNGTVTETYTYNWLGQMLTATDGNGNTTTNTYDNYGRITSKTNPDNTTVSYTYSTVQNTTTVEDELDNQVVYQYDPYGNLSYILDVTSGEKLKQYTYDSLFRITEETNANDCNEDDILTNDKWSRTTYSYDALNRLTDKRVYDQSNKLLSRESHTYSDVYNHVGDLMNYSLDCKTVWGDTSNIITNILRDKYGRVVKAQVMQTVNSAPYWDTYTYDYLGNKLTLKTALDQKANPSLSYTSKWVYDYANRVIIEYNAEGNDIVTVYDGAGRKTSVTDYMGNTTTYTYDKMGHVLTESVPFDTVNNVVVNKITKYYYDCIGNVVKQKTTNNDLVSSTSYATTEYIYNSRNMLTGVKNYEDTTVAMEVQYSYDATGNQLTKKIIAADSNDPDQTTVMTYDRFGRLDKVLYPAEDPLVVDDQLEDYNYDLNGNLVEFIDRDGNTTSYEYDGLGRVLSESVTDGTTTQTKTTAYTLDGQVKTLSEGGVTYTFIYDNAGRKTSQTEGDITKTYTYNIGGQLVSETMTVDANTTTTSYDYDSMGRVLHVYNGSIDVANIVATYQYDDNGNRESLVYANGNSTEYTYNLANMVKTLSNYDDTTPISNFTYAYRLDGNQIAKTESVGSTVNIVTSYTYDDLGRLTQESATDYTVTPNTVLTTDYTYDEFGNRKTKTTGGITTTYYYDLNNRLTSEATGLVTTEYDYDENGNQISKKVGTDPAELNEYDLFGRLVDANGATYTYSPDDLRRTKTISGTTTQFVWNGDNMVAELVSGAVQALYRYGINLISSTVSGTTKYYIYNAHGDVVQLADSTGAVVKTYHYDAFGNEVNPDAADTNPFRYSGEYFDKETGTYYLRARYYDPAIGRFISQDGMEYIKDKDPLSLNLYVYCQNSPVISYDPSGHMKVDMLRQYSGLYNSGMYTDEQLSRAVILSNGGGIWTAFHEIAQLNIARQLNMNGLPSVLEYKITSTTQKTWWGGNKTYEADVVSGSFVWEVKPMHGKDPKKQLELYKTEGNLQAGFVMKTIRDIRIMFDYYMQVEFVGSGYAYYSFYKYNDGKKQEVTTTEMYKVASMEATIMMQEYYWYGGGLYSPLPSPVTMPGLPSPSPMPSPVNPFSFQFA